MSLTMTLIGALAIAASLHWQMALVVGMFAEIAWIVGGRRQRKLELVWRAAGRVHQELWIAAPVGLVLAVVECWRDGRSWMIPFYALALHQWWRFRDWPDENRWKRRGRKAKEAITVRAGRLVVVPAEATS